VSSANRRVRADSEQSDAINAIKEIAIAADSLPTALPDMDLCFGTMVVYAATAALAHYVNQPGMMHTSGDAGAITTSGPPCGH